MREVQRLQNEAAYFLGPPRPGVPGGGEAQLVLSPRHTHKKEAALLLKADVALRKTVLDQRCWQLNGIAPSTSGELIGGEPHQEDHGKLQPLGLVKGEDIHRIHVHVCFCHRRVFTSLEKFVLVLNKLSHAIEQGNIAEPLHPFEEAGDVLHLDLAGDVVTGREPLQKSTLHKEMVQDLTGPERLSPLDVRLKILQEFLDGRDPLTREVIQAGSVEMLKDPKKATL